MARKIPFNQFQLYSVIIVGSLTYIYWLFRFWSFSVDDAFISLRYAANFADGFGLRWNPQQEPIEGYTSFLHIAALAFLKLLGLDLESANRAIGLAASSLTALVLFIEVKRWTNSLATASILTATYLVAPSTALHATSGLETPLFTLLLTICYCQAINITLGGESTSSLRNFFVSGLLLGLTRPEGVLIFSVLGLSALVNRRLITRPATIYSGICWYLIPAIGYMAWRIYYFSNLFPNTFYVKSLSHAHGSLISKQSIEYVSEFLQYYCAVPFLFFISRLFRQKIVKVELLGMAMVIATLLFYLTVNTSMMGYVYRFLIPLYPSVLIIGAFGLSDLIDSTLDAVSLKVGRIILCVSLLIATYVGSYKGGDNKNSLWWATDYSSSLRNAHGKIGRILNTATTPGLMMISDAGLAPFFARNWAVLDYEGLNDNYLAKHAFSVDYIFKKAPNVLVLTNFHPSIVCEPRFELLASDPRFSNYELAARYTFNSRYFEFVYIRKDVEFNSLIAAFKNDTKDLEQPLRIELYEKLTANQQFSLLATRSIYFPSGIRIFDLKANSNTFVGRVEIDQPIQRPVKYFFHIYDSKNSKLLSRHDFYPSAPFAAMQAGNSYPIVLTLNEPLLRNVVVHFGIFDERSPNFERLKLDSGDTELVFRME